MASIDKAPINRLVILLPFLACVLSGQHDTATPSIPPNLTEKVDSIFSKWNSTESPGCALSVMRANQIIYKRGYGIADLDHDVPIRPDSVLHVASVSKQFTATAIRLPALEGKLSLDDKVRKYIPELPGTVQNRMPNLSSRTVRLALSLIGLWFVILGSLYEGARFGRIFETNQLLFELPRRENLRASFRQLVGLERSYAQFLQDSWIVLSVMPNKRDGFYVDVGSADGELISNTKRLDELGWKGVCIDPFPANMERRTCQVFRQPVFSESGKKVKFRTAGLQGGIDSHLNRHKNEISPVVELVTATLDEILSKAKAPRRIDYMSIDIEGAELEALRGLSLDKYDVDAFTIEHNNEYEKREAVRQLLEGKGYVRVRSWVLDDWYLRRHLANKYHSTLEFHKYLRVGESASMMKPLHIRNLQ